MIKNLINSGYKVNCLDLKRPDYPSSKNFKFFKGNINDKKLVKKAISNCKVIIHLAASLGVQHTDRNIIECLDLNIYGTRILLEIAQEIKVPQKFMESKQNFLSMKILSLRISQFMQQAKL